MLRNLLPAHLGRLRQGEWYVAPTAAEVAAIAQAAHDYVMLFA